MRLLLLAALAAAPALAPAAQGLRAAGPAVPLAGTPEAPLAHALWSPAGDALLASRPDHDGLWRLTPEGAARALHSGPAYGPEWSPDGAAVLLRVSREDGVRRDHAVAVLDAASGEATVLSDWRANMPTLPRWSADGTAVLLAERSGGAERFETGRAAPEAFAGAGGPAFLLAKGGVIAAEGSAARPLALPEGARVLNPVASPDRGRVAFEVVGGNLFVAHVDGSDAVDLGPGHRPTWSPDGRWVAFMRTEDDGHDFTAADLYAARADGSSLVRLTDASGLEMNPSWSPDGTRIAFDDGETVYLLPLTAE